MLQHSTVIAEAGKLPQLCPDPLKIHVKPNPGLEQNQPLSQVADAVKNQDHLISLQSIYS